MPQIQHIKNVPASVFPWFVQKLSKLELISAERVQDLPAAEERTFFTKMGVKSLLIVPLISSRALTGFIGFGAHREEKKWPESVQALYKMLGDVFTNAFERKRFSESILQRSEDLQLINSLNNAVNRGVDVGDLLYRFASGIRRIFGGLTTAVLFLSDDRQSLYLNKDLLSKASTGALGKIFPHALTGIGIRLVKGSLFDRILKDKKPALFDTKNKLRSLFREYLPKNGYKRNLPLIHSRLGFTAMLAVPMTVKAEVLGILLFAGNRPYSQADIERLVIMSGHLVTLVKRRRAEEERDKSEIKYRRLAETAKDLIIALDVTGRVTYMNSAAQMVSGMRPEAPGGISVYDLIPPEYPAEMLTLKKKGEGGSREFAFYEAELKTRDGSHIPVEINSSLMLEAGVPAGILMVVRDIRERKRFERDIILARDMAEKANRAKSEFLSVMSHELRTPLTSIIGFSELFYNRKLGTATEEERGICERIIRNSKHLLGLINSILNLAKIEAGHVQMQPGMVSLGHLIGETVTVITPLLAKKPIEVSLSIPENLPEIETDGIKLKQILLNLLSNAIKFTNKGTITVTVEQPGHGDTFRICVADTGIGIPPEKIGSIFEKFEQGESGYTRKYGGTGLGLTISRALVEMLGGTIEAASTEGVGSVFSVNLPFRQAKRANS